MKHLLTLTILCLGFLAQAQIPSYVPTNGLVGWWPFNGNANDESGNGNHGTVNGATLAADRFGNAEKAYSFDGVNDYIPVPNIAISGNQARSIFFWVKYSSTTSYQCVVSTGSPSACNTFNVFCNMNNSNGNIGVMGYNPCDYYSSTTNMNNSLWNNIGVVFDGQGTLSTYLNGNLYSNSSLSFNTIGQNNFFGKSNHIPCCEAFFNGLLDDIAIYNRALSASEVQQLYLGACAKPTFTLQPQNKSVAQGQTTTFAVQVDSASSFQWQMNQGYGQNWVNLSNSAQISGVTTHTLYVEGRYQIDGAQFRCIATSCKADTSNAATLTVTSSATAAAGTVSGVPGLINYQGSALDSAGKPMKNQTISLKLSVLDSSSSGAAVYVESHSTATNGSGHFAIQFGGGTANFGSFDSVGWANGHNKYLKTELSQNGTWVNLGTSQLVSVPYALVSGFSKRADEAKRALEIMDSVGNVFSVGYSNGQPTLVAAPGNGSASNPGSFACGQFVTYAGENYPTVQIGTQCWFQKNLNVGSMVLGANDQTNNSVLEKFCYDNDPANCGILGGLYQWAEAVQYQNGASNTTSPSPAFSGNVKGICPTGWHVPSDGDWCTLTTFLDSSVNCNTAGWTGTNAGGKMKSTSGLWTSPNNGSTNSSGFSVLPAGALAGPVNFVNIGNNSAFWSTSNISSNGAIYRYLFHGYSSIGRYESGNTAGKDYGFSVRCLKD